MIRSSFKIDPHDLYPMITLYAHDIDGLDEWLDRTGFAPFEVYRSAPIYSSESLSYGATRYSMWWVTLKFTEGNGGFDGLISWPPLPGSSYRMPKEHRRPWLLLLDIIPPGGSPFPFR